MSPVPGSGQRRCRSVSGSRGSRAELYDVARTGLGAKAVSIGFRFSGLAPELFDVGRSRLSGSWSRSLAYGIVRMFT